MDSKFLTILAVGGAACLGLYFYEKNHPAPLAAPKGTAVPLSAPGGASPQNAINGAVNRVNSVALNGAQTVGSTVQTLGQSAVIVNGALGSISQLGSFIGSQDTGDSAFASNYGAVADTDDPFSDATDQSGDW